MDSSDHDSAYELLKRSLDGDRGATELLCDRLRPALRRWARGRLPSWAREGIDTEDIVQDALMKTLTIPGPLELRDDFQAYIRATVLNSIRDRVRKIRTQQQAAQGMPPPDQDDLDTPLRHLLGKEQSDRYEAALDRLPAQDRELVISRVELGLSYREIADATGRATPDAARMAVARALVRLSAELGDAS